MPSGAAPCASRVEVRFGLCGVENVLEVGLWQWVEARKRPLVPRNVLQVLKHGVPINIVTAGQYFPGWQGRAFRYGRPEFSGMRGLHFPGWETSTFRDGRAVLPVMKDQYYPG